MKLYVDGENAILGRLGSFVSKKLLQGYEVEVVNSGGVIITGDRKVIVNKMVDMRQKGGASQKGPKITKLPDRMLKRKIRGMLPRENAKGREALKRLKCIMGNPLTEAQNKELIKLNHKMPSCKYMKLGDVIKFIGQ